MGEFYQVVVLAEKYYLEYKNKATGWKTRAVEITLHQVISIEELSRKQSEDMEKLLKTYVI